MKIRKKVKVLVDMLMAVLYILLLGYVLTGGQFHEIAGIVFVALVVIHNLLNIGWYKAIKNGSYNKKRKMMMALNMALVIDVTFIAITGILNSRYLFHFDMALSGIGQIHRIAALIGFVLIVWHILFHAFSHSKTKHKKLPVVLAVLACVVAILLDVWLLPYLTRHFKTVEMNKETAISGESVAYDGGRVITIYFTRIGNTNFEPDVDAVSGASLMLDENGELLGNSQVIAQMIQNAVGGDILSINTEEKYPSSYSATVSAASKEMKLAELPHLMDMPESLEEYDTIFLVYPLWWFTIPKPVEAFLSNYDLSGKTLIPVVTHGGSGAGSSIEDIKAVCNAVVVETPLEIYCDDVPQCRDAVTDWLKELSE